MLRPVGDGSGDDGAMNSSVPSTGSQTALLVIHGLRVLGGPSLAELADFYELDYRSVHEELAQARERGWATSSEFFGATSWYLSDTGRAHGERLTAAELDDTRQRAVVAQAHADFLPLNRRHGQACTDWQLRPTTADRLAENDHRDREWDARILAELDDIATQMYAVLTRLEEALPRFGVHEPRYREAMERVQAGESAWLNAPDRASCQIVWIQLHEDLLATLGIPRGTDG